ncbi:MAG: nucleotidyltransferase family protein [Bacteroidota bacterium]
MIKEAILLAGGLGTRLQKVVNDVPKPMAPVSGRPFVEHVLDYLIASGIKNIIFSIGYKHEVFTKHFGNSYKNLKILYSIEDTPLGTGGGIRKAMKLTRSHNVLVVNADTIFKVDIAQFYMRHKKNIARLSIALRHIDDVIRYGSVGIDDYQRVIFFSEKDTLSGPGYINGGVYIFRNDFFYSLNLPEKFSLEKDCLEKFYLKLKISGFPSNAYFLDIGIPEDYEKAQYELI